MSAADGGWEALVGARLEGGRIEEEGEGRGVSGPSPSSRAWDGRLLGAGCWVLGALELAQPQGIAPSGLP